MGLVALLEAPKDRDRVGHGRFADEHRLEAPLERGILLDVLPVLVQRRRADRAQLTAREHRLQQVARRDRALGRARPDDGVELVDEEDDLALGGGDLGEHRLEALLELAAILRARDQRADVERPDALALQPLGNIAGDDPLRKPLGDRRLADAWLADEDRVVLRAPREHLDRPPDLLVTADDGVELARLGERRQVAPVLLERLVGALGILARDPLPAAHLLERGEQGVARDEVEGEQQMLDGDVLVTERLRLVERAREHALNRPPCLGGCGTTAADGRLRAQARLRLGAQRRGVGAGALDERARKLLVEQGEREMVLGELGVAEPSRELLGRADGLAALHCQLGEVHGWFLLLSPRWGLRLVVQDDVPAVLPVGRANLVAELALSLLHAVAEPAQLVLEPQHVLDAGEIEAELGGEPLDQPEPLHVGLRVEPCASRCPRRAHEPFRLVHPQRLRVEARELGGDGDHEERSVGHENAPFRGCSLDTCR